jgi:hypothetical protein
MKYIVWVKQNGIWHEQGDGPLSEREAKRIAREIRQDCHCPTQIRPADAGAPL